MGRPRSIPTRLAELADDRLTGAACAGMAPLFDADLLPGEDIASAAERHATAVRTCQGCPVRTPCRAVVLELGEKVTGVWGGHVHTGACPPTPLRAPDSPGEASSLGTPAVADAMTWGPIPRQGGHRW